MLGAYGAITLRNMVLRAGGWRENEELPSGTIIPGEVSSAWPLTNRLAMSSSGHVRYFMSPREAEEMAPVLQEQLTENPAMAMHDAAHVQENPEGLSEGAARAARMRAAKALKALTAAQAAV